VNYDAVKFNVLLVYSTLCLTSTCRPLCCSTKSSH